MIIQANMGSYAINNLVLKVAVQGGVLKAYAVVAGRDVLIHELDMSTDPAQDRILEGYARETVETFESQKEINLYMIASQVEAIAKRLTSDSLADMTPLARLALLSPEGTKFRVNKKYHDEGELHINGLYSRFTSSEILKDLENDQQLGKTSYYLCQVEAVYQGKTAEIYFFSQKEVRKSSSACIPDHTK